MISLRALLPITSLALLALAGCGTSSPSSPTGGSGSSSSGSASSSSSGGGPPKALQVYVAGESIERRNRYVEAPFTAEGGLNDRGGGPERNDDEEYGWMVPLADRLLLRDSGLTIEWVGADTWLDADDNPYDGTYPSATPANTSAISGTDIDSWVMQRKDELIAKAFCYTVAFASRGGNDFGNDNDVDYKTRLKDLVKLLAAGSSCTTDPLIYVTGHMPDDQRGGSGNPADVDYIAQQKQRFVDRAKQAVDELKTEAPAIRARFVDMYTPFLDNKPTTAFPSEVWSTGGILDFAKITRTGDMYHPRRLASIFAGENVADALDINELRGM